MVTNPAITKLSMELMNSNSAENTQPHLLSEWRRSCGWLGTRSRRSAVTAPLGLRCAGRGLLFGCGWNGSMVDQTAVAVLRSRAVVSWYQGEAAWTAARAAASSAESVIGAALAR